MSDQLVNDEASFVEDGTSTDTQESLEQQEASTSEETSNQEASESESEGTSREEEWVVPGRFKTKDDLVKSYQNLEAEFSRRNNELYRLKNQVSQPKVDPEQETREFADAVKRNPVEALNNIVDKRTQAIREEARQVRFEAEYNRQMQNKEFAELEPVMAQIATQYDDLIMDNNLRNDPRLLSILYLAAKGSQADRSNKNAERKGLQKGEKTALRKAKAQLEGDSGTQGHKSINPETLSAADMKKAILAGKLKI